MSVSTILLPLLLLLSGSSASHFNGGTMTFNPKGVNADGSYTVDIRFKLAINPECPNSTWANICTCQSVNCGSISSNALYNLDSSSGDWCQWEEVMIRNVDTNLPFILELTVGDSITREVGYLITPDVGDISWRLRTTVDLGVRSDTRTANRSPQTTVIPLLLVPMNCPRDFQLLAHDPDGDLVQCRQALLENQECADCSPLDPSIFILKFPCTLSYGKTAYPVENTYRVELVMEDFPAASLTLSYKDDSQSRRHPNISPLSKLPVQFDIKVGAAVPSCAEGEYLPRFLSPTPAYGTHFYVSVNNTLEISVRAEANLSGVSELLVSGPHDFIKITTAPGQFTIRWTPTADDDRQDHPICFVSQALNKDSPKYHSELRCVIVTVGNLYTTPAPETMTQMFTTNTTTIPDATNTTPTFTTTTPTFTTTTPTFTTTTPTNTTTTPDPKTTSQIFTTNTTTIPDATTTTPTLTTSRPKFTTTIQRNTTTTLNKTSTTPTNTTTKPTPKTTTPTPPTTAPTPTTSTPTNTTTTTTPIPTTPTPATTILPPTTATPKISTRKVDNSPTSDVSRVPVGLTMRVSSVTKLNETYIKEVFLHQLQEELIRRGLPADITVGLRKVQALSP